MRVLRLFGAELDMGGVCSFTEKAPSSRPASKKFAYCCAPLEKAKHVQVHLESESGAGPRDLEFLLLYDQQPEYESAN